MAVLTTGLKNLQRQLTSTFPQRHLPDGWIGDRAHQGNTSGHNPDDTSGSRPAWSADPDTLAEVRALDVAADLGPDVDSMDVVRHLLKLPKFGTVVRYVIHRGRIFHSRDGFLPTPYGGGNPHNHHIHFEGAWSQGADNNSSFDFNLEDIPVALTPEDKNWLKNAIITAVDARADAIERKLLAELPAAVGDLKVNVTPGAKTASMQPWSKVDAYGSPERHRIEDAVKALRAEVAAALKKLPAA